MLFWRNHRKGNNDHLICPPSPSTYRLDDDGSDNNNAMLLMLSARGDSANNMLLLNMSIRHSSE